MTKMVNEKGKGPDGLMVGWSEGGGSGGGGWGQRGDSPSLADIEASEHNICKLPL